MKEKIERKMKNKRTIKKPKIKKEKKGTKSTR